MSPKGCDMASHALCVSPKSRGSLDSDLLAPGSERRSSPASLYKTTKMVVVVSCVRPVFYVGCPFYQV